MICPMKQIMNLDSKYIDSYFQKKKKYIFLNKKKVHRFLQYEMEEKKMIDVHTVNKKNKKIEIFAKILCSEYMFLVK